MNRRSGVSSSRYLIEGKPGQVFQGTTQRDQALEHSTLQLRTQLPSFFKERKVSVGLFPEIE